MEISIILVTYNHERYVRQALESILEQKIKVPYEIIIFDDASSDNTPQILKEYKRKFPDLIRLYLKKVNRCHVTKNVYFILSKVRGKYCAYLEGDDFWIDNRKIQKQYEFLENHPEFSACTTGLKIVDEKGNEKKASRKFYYEKEDHVYTLEDFRQQKLPGMTVSFFTRNFFSQIDTSIIYKADKNMGDATLYMLCVLRGNIYQFDEQMSAYRRVEKANELNFVSIHKENTYKDLNLFRYYIRVEDYIRQNYDKDFTYPMKTRIVRIAQKYPLNAFLKVILPSSNRIKYLLYFLVGRYLLSSRFAIKEKNVHFGYQWSRFVKEKRPIIIFGAGSICSEYLDRYAWKDNILFLVDNDLKKQNTSFKGYLVKKPEEILNFKDKACVLVVNQQYEQEIYKQLLDMGVDSVYCYCSMQSKRVRNVIAQKLLEMCDEC